MDVNKTFQRIKELGLINSNREELREYCTPKINEIIKFLPRRLVNSDGGILLDCILNGIPDTNKYKVKIVDIVLETMRKESTSLTHCNEVVSRLCLELQKLPIDDLVRCCNASMQTIMDDSDVNMIWRDVLPESLNALASYPIVKHCGTDMPYVEFKEQCVHTLCQCKWTERQLVQLVAMFKDIQLARPDHKQVVNKICSYIIDIPPDILPPLVHQLLKLCKVHHLEIVLSNVSRYFSARLYNKLEPPPQDSESTTMDLDDIVQYSPAELSRCLSTCLYHITQGAVEPELIRKHIKNWPRTQLLRSPFLIDIALALCDKGPDFRSVCLDAIKSAIEQRILDERKCKESAWIRSIIPPDVDIATILNVLTTESNNHRALTVSGLISLSLVLLNVHTTRVTSRRCWSLGTRILVRLSKSQPETVSTVLQQLGDTLHTHPQSAECLHLLCKLTPLSIERCSHLSTILENCQPSANEYKTAAAVLDAVHPLINFSTRTRDTLVMVCRKGLHSRDSLHRCLALTGFLSVLRHIKLQNTVFSSSQSMNSDQYSTTSYLTQLTVDLHAENSRVTSRVRNEAMCLEVVSILRRCLSQDAPVKHLLYTNIYDCVKDKPALQEPILELLYEHLSQYLSDSTEQNTPVLDLSNCVTVSATTAVLNEPIPYLLYAISQFLQAIEDEDLEDILSSQDNVETASAYLKGKLTSVMEQLTNCEQFGQIDMDDPGLTDLTPESRAKSIKVQLTLQCYGVLVAHHIMVWKKNTNVATQVYRLYKAGYQLLEQTKSPSKSKKGNKSNLNETRDTVKSTQKSQKSQKGKGKAPIKISNLVKEKSGPFKPLPCVWDLRLCVRIVELLYSEEVPWSSLEQRNQIRTRRDFHHWCLKNMHSVLTDGSHEKRLVANYVVKLATVLYHRCICRYQDMTDFDEQTTLGCLEVFKDCLSLILSSNYSFKIENLLSSITGKSDLSAGISIAAILEEIHSSLSHIDEDIEAEETSDLSVKKLVATLVQIAALLLDVPEHCIELAAVVVKFEDYIRKSRQDWLPLLPALLAASCRLQQETPIVDEILNKLDSALGRIDEDDTSAAEESPIFPLIDSKTGHTVLSNICEWSVQGLNRVQHCIVRPQTPGRGNEIQETFKCCVIQLWQLSRWITRVVKLRCTVGAGSDKVISACVKMYTVCTNFAKHIPVDLVHIARLDRLLKVIGKKLSSAIDNLISYIEASQTQSNAGKVLKDTKLIPRLVLAAETCTSQLTLLGNQAKVDFQQYLSLGTARDFRIRAPILQEVLNARENRRDEAEEDIQEDNDNINDAATEILIPMGSDNENAGSDEENLTARKRQRRS